MLRQVHHVGDRVRDVVRAERLEPLIHRLGARAVPMEAHLRKLGFHESRIYRRHAQRRARHVEIHPLREGAHPELGRVVHVSHRVRLVAGGGADVHDVPAPPGDHVRHDRPAHVQQPLQVGVDHAIPVFGVAFVNLGQAAGEPRVVDEDVRHATGAHQGLRGPLDGRAVSHVDHGERERHPVLRTELGRQLFEAIGAPSPEDQVSAFGGEPPRARLPDPRARPRDENQLPLDSVHRLRHRMFPVCPSEKRPGCGQTQSPWGSRPTGMRCASRPVSVSKTYTSSS